MPGLIRFIGPSGTGSNVGIGLSSIVGPTGAQGFQGLIGPTGAGVAGAQGFQGFQGFQGLIGHTGSDGPQGFQGFQGFQGLIGATGTDGVQGLAGPQGAIGQGFVIFATTDSFNNLCTTNPTGSNVGEFVLVTGGALYLYAGSGVGNTGPTGCETEWIYSGDVTDESLLIGPTGAAGPQGFQGLIGSTGPSASLTGSYDNLTINNLTIGTQIQMATGSILSSSADTIFTDTNFNVANIFTVNAVTSAVQFGNYTGGVITTNISVNGVNGTIYATGSSGIGYFKTIYADQIVGASGVAGAQGFQGFQGLIGATGADGPQGLIGATGAQGFQGFQGLIGATGTVDFSTGTFTNLTVSNNLTVGTQIQMTTGSILSSTADTIFTDANFNVSNIFTVNATTADVTFANYTGGQIVSGIVINGISNTINASTGDTLFTDTNLNVANIFTVNAVTSAVQFGNYTGGVITPNISINGVNGTIYATGSSGIGYFKTIYVDQIIGASGVAGPQGSQGLVGSTGSDGPQGLVGATGADGPQGLVGATGAQGFQGFQGLIGATGTVDFSTGTFTNLTVSNNLTVGTQIQMTTGSILSSTADTIFTDANFNVSNIFTVNATTADVTFANYTGGQIVSGIVINGISNTINASTGDTLFTDTNLNVANIFTVNAVTSAVQFGNYTGGVITPNISINGVNGTIYATGSSGAGYFKTLYVDQIIGAATGPQGFQGLIGATGPQGFQGLIGETGPQGFQGFIGATGPQGFQGFQGLIGATGTVDFSTGTFTNLTVANNLTVGTQMIMTTGSILSSSADTLFTDANFNVSNIFTVNATTADVIFANYTGGIIYPGVTINGINRTINASTGDTLFTDTNLNVANIFTVNAVNSNVQFGNYTGGVITTNITVNGINGSIYATGSTGVVIANEYQAAYSSIGLTGVTGAGFWTGATGVGNSSRGRASYFLEGTEEYIRIDNSLVRPTTSVFTSISGWTNASGSFVPTQINRTIPSAGYFTIYFATPIGDAGDFISIDWMIFN